MKLVDWLKERKLDNTIDYNQLRFNNDQLNQLLYPILSKEIDEFSECGSDFSFISTPSFEEGGIVKQTITHMVNDNFKIPKGAVLYSFLISPEMVDENMNPVYNAMVRMYIDKKNHE